MELTRTVAARDQGCQNEPHRVVFRSLPRQSTRLGRAAFCWISRCFWALWKGEYDLPENYLDSIVLIEDGIVFANSRAVLRIARKLTGIWPILYGLRVIPVVISDSVYGWIARNRYNWFGRLDRCSVPTEETRSRFI